VRIWYDAGTGKHIRYGNAIAETLRKHGYQVTLTTRKHPDTLSVAKTLKEAFLPIGQYNPRTLMTRLKGGTKRQLALCKLFEKHEPNVAISHGSVDLCRVAFGLGKPVITTVDTPYADAVHRLTLPLSKYIVASKAIPENTLQHYNLDAHVISFNGVDEVAWIKDFKPTTKYEYGKPLIVFRQLEEHAIYTKNRYDSLVLAKKLTELGNVVFLSRYTRKNVKGLIVPNNFVDSASLVAQADLFVGVGGTITREAALQGTPAIIINLFQQQYVNDFLIEKGFPIYRTDVKDLFKVATECIGKRKNVSHLLDSLENPVDTIASVVDKIRND
jgi:predicted glycosyltransferase